MRTTSIFSVMLCCCLLVLLACAAFAGADCPSGDWTERGQFCYYASRDERSWVDARAFCRSRGADLVSIQDELENGFASELQGATVGPRVHFWIGLNDRLTEGQYRWSDGSPVSYVNWGKNQPDGTDSDDCIYTFSAIDAPAGKVWYDATCLPVMHFMCKVAK